MLANRRKFMMGAIVSVGGAALLASCGQEPSIKPTERDEGQAGRFYSASELAFITRFADLLIPETDTVGAVRAGVPNYLDGLMADWASQETKEKHKSFLASLVTDLDSVADGGFVSAEMEVARMSLLKFDTDAYASSGANDYKRFKQLVAQAYEYTELGAEASGWTGAPPGRWDAAVEKDYS